MKYRHIPVMLSEIIEYLDPQPGDYIVDCTLGGAGYTIELAKKVGKEGRVLSVDLDQMAIENAEKRLKEEGLENVILVQDNFKNIAEIVDENFPEGQRIKGIVFDLGFSSAQLDDKERGFSFQNNGPLNMSFDSSDKVRRIVNGYQEHKLFEIIKDYGEERYARSIAKKIVLFRKEASIEDTEQLVEIIASAVPGMYRRGGIHFATRTFQALRIEANQELKNLKEVLPNCLKVLQKGSRIAVVSFHSLEDRIVKQYFKHESKDCICPPKAPVCVCGHKAKLKILTKKIVLATDEEKNKNPRSRSAKLRVAELIK